MGKGKRRWVEGILTNAFIGARQASFVCFGQCHVPRPVNRGVYHFDSTAPPSFTHASKPP
jgi:hypothetical protein